MSYLTNTPFFAVSGQETDEEELERQLCEGKGAGEWFRLETGSDKCRDVIQCTASVSRRLKIGCVNPVARVPSTDNLACPDPV